MNNEKELKPCPFCGKIESLEIESKPITFTDSPLAQYRILCNAHKRGCGCSSGWECSKEDVIKYWNWRA